MILIYSKLFTSKERESFIFKLIHNRNDKDYVIKSYMF